MEVKKNKNKKLNMIRPDCRKDFKPDKPSPNRWVHPIRSLRYAVEMNEAKDQDPQNVKHGQLLIVNGIRVEM